MLLSAKSRETNEEFCLGKVQVQVSNFLERNNQSKEKRKDVWRAVEVWKEETQMHNEEKKCIHMLSYFS